MLPRLLPNRNRYSCATVQAFERKRSKEEREITQQMRPLARFHSQEHHEQFVNGLIEEMRIRKKIDQLMKYRSPNLYDVLCGRPAVSLVSCLLSGNWVFAPSQKLINTKLRRRSEIKQKPNGNRRKVLHICTTLAERLSVVAGG